MKYVYFGINIFLLRLAGTVVFYGTGFSLASKDYVEQHWKPHLFEFIATRFLLGLIIVLLLSLVSLGLNTLLLMAMSLPRKIYLKKTVLVEFIIMMIISMVTIFLMVKDL